MAAKVGMKEAMLVLSFMGTIILGFVWVDERYQRVKTSICLSQESTLSQEIGENSLRLEFYTNEMMLSTTSDFRRTFLNSMTLSLEERQRVIKKERKDLGC